MTLLEILALLPLAFWLGLTLDRRRSWPRECFLDPETRSPEAGREGAVPISVTAVVPARDEVEVLPLTLPALLGQEVSAGDSGVGFSVVLVDDGSTDGTARVAREVAEREGLSGRLEVIEPPPCPPDWTGKVHALAHGVEHAGASPDWLLLTDADIRHRPGSLAALLAKAREGPYDLVSVMARLHATTFWERLLVPPFVFYFQLLYPFRRVRRPGRRGAAAAGGCILVRRETLAAAGGLETIRNAVIDDVSLAKRVAATGGRLWLGFDPGIVSVRPYRGLAELWRMVARSAFVQLRFRWDLLAAVLVGLAVLVVAPPFVAMVAGWRLWEAAGGASAGRALVSGWQLWIGPAGISAGRALVAALGTWALEAAALTPAVRHHRVGRAWAWSLPFASILYGAMTLSSAWSHLAGRGTRWKGRAYRDRG